MREAIQAGHQVSAPERAAVNADNQLEIELLRKIHDFVESLPCRHLPDLIVEIALLRLLDQLPRKVLLNPHDAGIARHLEGFLFLPELNLFMEKRVRSPRIDIRF